LAVAAAGQGIDARRRQRAPFDITLAMDPPGPPSRDQVSRAATHGHRTWIPAKVGFAAGVATHWTATGELGLGIADRSSRRRRLGCDRCPIRVERLFTGRCVSLFERDSRLLPAALELLFQLRRLLCVISRTQALHGCPGIDALSFVLGVLDARVALQNHAVEQGRFLHEFLYATHVVVRLAAGAKAAGQSRQHDQCQVLHGGRPPGGSDIVILVWEEPRRCDGLHISCRGALGSAAFAERQSRHRQRSYPSHFERTTILPTCHPHNLRQPTATVRPYGIRVTLKGTSPFRNLLGDDWQKVHWFGTAAERDAALADMSSQPEVYRIGDVADVAFEKIENLAESRRL